MSAFMEHVVAEVGCEQSVYESDDWLFKSIEEYDKLHMYELQNPTHCIEMIGNSEICVACHQTSGKSELLVLTVPKQLLQQGSTDSMGIAKDRDFHVTCGAFHDGHLTEVKHLPGMRKLIAAEKGNCISLWQLPDTTAGAESGMILKNVTLKDAPSHSYRVHLSTVDGKSAAFGSCLNDLKFLDINTWKTTYSTQESPHANQIASIQFLDAHTLLTMTKHEGHIWILDTRQKVDQSTCYTAETSSLDHQSLFAFDVCHRTFTSGESAAMGDARIVKYKSDGMLSVLDSRNLSKHVLMKETCLQCDSGCENLHLRCCPLDENLVGISGVDGSIALFDLLQDQEPPSKSASSSKLEPCFIHQGHVACTEEGKGQVKVTTHIWHAVMPRSIFSAASDGSLHAWQFVRK